NEEQTALFIEITKILSKDWLTIFSDDNFCWCIAPGTGAELNVGQGLPHLIGCLHRLRYGHAACFRTTVLLKQELGFLLQRLKPWPRQNGAGGHHRVQIAACWQKLTQCIEQCRRAVQEVRRTAH